MSANFAGKFTTSGDSMQAPSASNGEGIGARIGDNMKALIDGVIGERKRKRDNKMELEVDEDEINVHDRRALLYIVLQRR
jgi:hypothetical protein